MTKAPKRLLPLIAAASLCSPTCSAFAGPREKGSELYNATTNWQVLLADATGTWYFDPNSLINSGNQWDLNITFLNNSNQYQPDETGTVTVDCATDRIRRSGWRINGAMEYYKGRDGAWTPIEANTVSYLIKSWMCGLSVNERTYYGIVADFEVSGKKETFEQWWIRDNEVYISSVNSDIRMMYVLNYKLSKNMNYFGSLYARCSDNSIMLAADGKVATRWTPVQQNAPLNVAVNRACDGRSPFLKMTNQEMDIPESLSPKPAPEVASSQAETVQNRTSSQPVPQDKQLRAVAPSQPSRPSRLPQAAPSAPPPDQDAKTYTYGGVTVTCETISGNRRCH